MTNLGRHFSVCTHEHGFSSRILGIGDGQFSELCWVHGLCGLKVNSVNLNNACCLRDCIIILHLKRKKINVIYSQLLFKLVKVNL